MKDSKATQAQGNRDADDFDEDFDLVEPGRESIYTQVGEWVAYAPISDRAVRVYWLLRAHVNVSRKLPDGRPDPRAFPSQKRLAAILRVKRTETITAAVDELVEIGAVTLRKKRYANRLRRRNVYIVHMNPPDGHTGTRSNQDFELPDDAESTPPEASAVPAEAPGADQQVPEKPQVTPDPPENRVRTPRISGCNKTKNNKTKDPSSPTARPRSAERGAARLAKPKSKRTTRRADYPTDDAWISDDLDELVSNILAHAEEQHGAPPGLEALLLGKITPPLDPETFDELPFDPPAPRHLMNIALKAARWGTTDFSWIHQQETAGQVPAGIDGSSVNDDPWAAAS